MAFKDLVIEAIAKTNNHAAFLKGLKADHQKSLAKFKDDLKMQTMFKNDHEDHKYIADRIHQKDFEGARSSFARMDTASRDDFHDIAKKHNVPEKHYS